MKLSHLFLTGTGIVLCTAFVFAKNDYPGEPDSLPPAYFEKFCEDAGIDHQIFDGEYCVCSTPYVREKKPGVDHYGNATFTTIWEGKYYKHTVYNCVEEETFPQAEPGLIPPANATNELGLIPPPITDALMPMSDNFGSLTSDGEMTLDPNNALLQSIKDGADEAEYQARVKLWQAQVVDAERTGKFKSNDKKGEYYSRLQEEKNIKLQIAQYQKLLGFTHIRVLESTKQFKFEFQSKEYQNYFKNPVESATDDTTNATIFNAMSANASSYSKLIRDEESKLSSWFPAGWKAAYLDVPAKPVRTSVVSKAF